jgi:hypothetical protein
MYDIVRIESTKLTPQENIEIIAILQKIEPTLSPHYVITVPTFAPLKCRTIIDRASLPNWITLQGANEEELQGFVNRYASLNQQEWEVLRPKFQDPISKPK